MKPDNRETPAAREPADAGPPAKTPNPDMQPEDAGSTDSGTDASKAVPSTDKPGADSGPARRNTP